MESFVCRTREGVGRVRHTGAASGRVCVELGSGAAPGARWGGNGLPCVGSRQPRVGTHGSGTCI
eukprot:scaffold135165_cov148-Phaeocystis_antarctica.AAC.1